jgi:peptide/nickel transport system substrate-binding protein
LRRTSFAAVCLAFLVALTSCPGKGPASRRSPGASTSPEEGVRGGVLRVLLSDDVDAIDPQRAGAPASFGLARAMHRGLMAFQASPGAEGAVPVPDLAESAPEVTPDGLRYTFRLREGSRFGAPASRPVRAADVKAGLERIFTARSPFSRYYRVIAGADALAAGDATGLAGVSATDERTIVIGLTHPTNDFLSLLALPAASAVPPGLAPAARPRDIAPSGPYMLAKDGYRPERSIHLIRNDAWSEDSDPVRRAYVDEIRFEIGASPGEMVDRIAGGRAHLIGDALPQGTDVTAIPAGRVVRDPRGCLRYLFMNTRVSPFTSAKVRSGVALAVDRAAVAASYGAGVAQAAATILPPTVAGYDPARPAPGADAAAAHGALAEAGYDAGFATTLVVGDTSLDRAQASEVRAALGRAGVRVTITVVPVASVYEDRYEVPRANTPMGIATWCADWPGPGGRGSLQQLVDGRRVASSGSTNYSGMNDPTLNRAMDAAAGVGDAARAVAAWLAADRRAVGAAAVVPLAFPAEISLLAAAVHGFVPHPYFVRGDLTAVWLGPG